MYHTIPVQIRRETTCIFKAYLNIFKTRMFQEKRWKLLSETMEVDSEGLSMELPYLQGNWKSRFQLQELTWHCNCPEMMTFYPKFLCTQLMKMGLLLKKILRTITYAWIIIYKRDQGSLPLKIKIKVFDGFGRKQSWPSSLLNVASVHKSFVMQNFIYFNHHDKYCLFLC